MVVVRLHGVLREEVGLTELEVDGASLGEVLKKLPEKVGGILRKYSRYLVFIVNGRVVNDLGIPLKPSDVIDLTIFVGGGFSCGDYSGVVELRDLRLAVFSYRA